MKMIVNRPTLSATDIVKLRSYTQSFGYQLIIDQEKRKFLVISPKSVGFIQKVGDRLLVVFKDGSIDNINKIASVTMLFDKYDITPGDQFDFKVICNIVSNAYADQHD